MSNKRRKIRKINGGKTDYAGRIIKFDESIQLGLIQANNGEEISFKPSECYGIGTPILPQAVQFKLAKTHSEWDSRMAVDIRPQAAVDQAKVRSASRKLKRSRRGQNNGNDNSAQTVAQPRKQVSRLEQNFTSFPQSLRNTRIGRDIEEAAEDLRKALADLDRRFPALPKTYAQALKSHEFHPAFVKLNKNKTFAVLSDSRKEARYKQYRDRMQQLRDEDYGRLANCHTAQRKACLEWNAEKLSSIAGDNRGFRRQMCLTLTFDFSYEHPLYKDRKYILRRDEQRDQVEKAVCQLRKGLSRKYRPSKFRRLQEGDINLIENICVAEDAPSVGLHVHGIFDAPEGVKEMAFYFQIKRIWNRAVFSKSAHWLKLAAVGDDEYEKSEYFDPKAKDDSRYMAYMLKERTKNEGSDFQNCMIV